MSGQVGSGIAHNLTRHNAPDLLPAGMKAPERWLEWLTDCKRKLQTSADPVRPRRGGTQGSPIVTYTFMHEMFNKHLLASQARRLWQVACVVLRSAIPVRLWTLFTSHPGAHAYMNLDLVRLGSGLSPAIPNNPTSVTCHETHVACW